MARAAVKLEALAVASALMGAVALAALPALAGPIGSLGSGSFNDLGLAFSGNRTLCLSSTTGGGQGPLFTVDTTTGHATLVRNFATGLRVRSLGLRAGKLNGGSNQDMLLDLDLDLDLDPTRPDHRHAGMPECRPASARSASPRRRRALTA